MIQTDYGFNKFQSSDEMYTTTMNGLNDNVDIEVGLFDQLNTTIANLQNENAELIAQIPSYTPTPATALNIQDSSNLPIKDFSLLGNASQSSTPTPDNPVPVSVVTGDNTLTFIGKNFFNPTYQIANQYNASGGAVNVYSIVNGELKNSTNMNSGRRLLNKTQYGAGTYRVSGKIRFDNATTYRLFYSVRDMGDTKVDIVAGTRITVGSASGTFSFSFTLTSDNPNISISLQPEASSDGTIYLSDIQVEKNSSATTYEPYTSQTQPISLGSIELAKIGTYQDRIYKSGGKWYLYKTIGKTTLNGSENWQGYTNLGDNARAYITKSNIIHLSNGYSNYFTISTSVDYYSTDTPAILFSPYTQSIIALKIPKNLLATTDIAGIKGWLNTNNVTTYYRLKTPTTTEITDTTLIGQLENVLQMSTYKNTTNIFSIVASGNAQGELKVEYRADLQTKLDNLQTAILSL